MRRSPFYPREEALGAVFFDARGWERPQWYESNATLLDRYPEAARPGRTSGTPAGGRRSRTPSTWRCVTASAWSTSRRSTSSTSRARRARLPAAPLRQQRRRAGWQVGLHAAADAGRRVPRRPHDHAPRPEHYRVVTGAFDGGRDQYWFRRHLPLDGSVTFIDRPRRCARSACGVRWRRRRWLVTANGRPMTTRSLGAAFPYGSVREVLVDGLPAIMFRISYVGENGWEIYVPTEHGLADVGRRLGRRPAHGIVPGRARCVCHDGAHREGLPPDGSRAGERVHPVEAGLARPKVKAADFIGKEAYLAAREREPAATLCTLADARAPSRRGGMDRYLTGGNEPIVTRRRRPHRRREGPGVQGDDRRRRAVARQVPAHGLPPARARRRGQRAARERT